MRVETLLMSDFSIPCITAAEAEANSVLTDAVSNCCAFDKETNGPQSITKRKPKYILRFKDRMGNIRNLMLLPSVRKKGHFKILLLIVFFGKMGLFYCCCRILLTRASFGF